MNILFLNSARTWGGNEQWARLAAGSLNGRGREVFLAYREDAVGERFGIPSIRLPFRHEADVRTLLGLVSFVRKNRIDILIPTKRKDYVIAGIVSRICGCINMLRLGIVRDLKQDPVQKFIFNSLADGVIVNALSIKQKLLETGFVDPERIRVIHNGLDRKTIEALAEEECPAPPFGFTVTAMGELSERKGFDMLIRGFALFLERLETRDAGLVIIGEGPMKKELQKIAGALGIEQRVVFTGFLQNPYPCLARSRVFAMTSRNEGIANALLEAALLDNAIVSTASGGGIRAVIREGDNGFLLEDDREEQLAEVLYRLHSNPELLDRTAREAKQTITDMFSLERMAGEMETFCGYLLWKRHGT